MQLPGPSALTHSPILRHDLFRFYDGVSRALVTIVREITVNASEQSGVKTNVEVRGTFTNEFQNPCSVADLMVTPPIDGETNIRIERTLDKLCPDRFAPAQRPVPLPATVQACDHARR
jgi:hypothetical protein